MTRIAFVDTETTGLSLDDDIWEFAAIIREPDGSEHQHHRNWESARKDWDRAAEYSRKAAEVNARTEAIRAETEELRRQRKETR